MIFADRADAGRRLAARLHHLRGEDVVVLGLPRGGVPVAYEVAREIDAPLDVIVVRKVGVPFQPELAMGAVGEGVRVVDRSVLRMARITDAEFAAVEARERAELQRRATRFRGDRPPLPLAGRTALIVDDGIATGSTARAACQVARAHGAKRVVLAVPVGPPDVARTMRPDADEVVCVATPRPFDAIGRWYGDFSQTTDEEVLAYLERAGTPAPALADADPAGATPARDEEIELTLGSVRLGGHLTVPAGAAGAVVFAHGSGSSRHSPRNRFVAGVLNRAGLATLLFDLLTPEEEVHRAAVFDVDLLADRLGGATRWLRELLGTGAGGIGWFGASTGAAAALWAAAEPGADVAAVVSRGGRPDLAADRLAAVRAPTLLIVGENDRAVLELNQQARRLLRCESRLAVVPGATHLFEEPGTLHAAADLAAGWFTRHLAGARHEEMTT